MNPLIIGAAAAAVTGAFALGAKVGSDIEAGKGKNRIIEEMQNATLVLDRKDGELEQCRAEVDKINTTVAAQGSKLAGLMAEDRRKREKATADAIARDRASQERLGAVLSTLGELRSKIDDGQFGVCAGELVPGEFVSLLNDAISAGGGVP